MIIFLYGPDTYRIQQKIKQLKNRFIREKDKSGLGITILDGRGLDLDTLRSRLYASGFFSDKRMIIIKNMLADADQEILQEAIDYLKKSRKDKDNIIVFVEDKIPAAKKENKNKFQKELLNLLKKADYKQEFFLLSGARLNQWIKKEIARQGGKITGPALNILAAVVGPDLWRLSSEINKLIAYCASQPIIPETVNLLVKVKLDENIFHLIDALGTKNKKNALRLLKEQLAAGNHLSRIFGMIVSQFRVLLQVKEALSAGQVNQWSLAKELGVHPYVVKKSLVQVGRFTEDELKNIYQKLLAVDVKIKTTQINPEVLLDLLIVGV